MATGSETIVNKALSGSELKSLLRQDFERLISNEGLLSDYLAYGRISFDIRLRLHMDNWMQPESISSIASRPIATNLKVADPALAAIEPPPPLASPSATAIVSAHELTHSIDSPNAERVLAGMPVSVMSRQADSTLVENKVRYPVPSPGDAPPLNIGITDTSDSARADWHQPAPAPAPIDATKVRVKG